MFWIWHWTDHLGNYRIKAAGSLVFVSFHSVSAITTGYGYIWLSFKGFLLLLLHFFFFFVFESWIANIVVERERMIFKWSLFGSFMFTIMHAINYIMHDFLDLSMNFITCTFSSSFDLWWISGRFFCYFL